MYVIALQTVVKFTEISAVLKIPRSVRGYYFENTIISDGSLQRTAPWGKVSTYLCPFVTENCTLDVGINKENYNLTPRKIMKKLCPLLWFVKLPRPLPTTTPKLQTQIVNV